MNKKISAQCHVLARAVIVAGHCILVARRKGSLNTFLPGGHVETGETIRDALSRELFEELGVASIIGPYFGAVEHFWCASGQTQWEVNHVFATSLIGFDSALAITACEPWLEFSWVPLTSLGSSYCRPVQLMEFVMRCIGFGAVAPANALMVDVPHASIHRD